jgi:outer membrane protein assembly factor BamA
MDSEHPVLYLTIRAVFIAAVGLGGGAALQPAWAQAGASSASAVPAWRMVVDGEAAAWPDAVAPAPLDSVRAGARRLLRHLRRDGYYHARLDSATVDTAARPPEVRVHVRRGPRVRVGAVRITGAEAVDSAAVRRLVDTEPGAPFDPRAFEADVQALLDRYEAAGRPLAQIRTETTLDTTTSRLALTLAIDEGPRLWLKAIEVPDDARTSPGLIARLTDLRVGAPLIDYDPAALRQSLRESPYFRAVGPPALRVTRDGGAILRVPVEEASPGAFDVVLGYLPPSGRGGGGQLVGSGELTLEHLFGGGRRLDLALNRRPGQTSIIDVSVSDPYVLGLPVRLTASFRGEQRDSTYGERRYGLGAGYQLTRAFEVSGRVSREVVTPGQSGGRLRDGRQRIPRAQTLFYGVGLRYEAVDRRVNPRRGVRLHVRADQGRKERTLRRVTAAGDTTRERSSLRQDRLRGTVRAFVPFFDRQVLVLGGDGAVLRSPSYDRSDLFRFGGAESLRGYDEDRFLGNVTVRGLVEYRLQLDRRSYAYVFGDLGYVERPALGAGRALQDWLPGYGLGLQIQTAIGRIRTTYALNPEVSTPADGRIHFGLSVGL